MKIFDNNSKVFPIILGLFLSVLPLGTAFSSIALAVLGAYVFFFSIYNRRKPQMPLAFILPIGLYLIYVLSLLWTIDFDITAKGLGRTLGLVIIPVIFSLGPRLYHNSVKIPLQMFTIANAAYAVLFIVTSGIDFIKTRSFSLFTYHELVSVLDLNSIYVSIYFVLSLCFLLSKKHKKPLDLVLIILFITMVILLSSKTVIAGMIVLIVLFALRNIKRSSLTNWKVVLPALAVLILVGLSSRTIVFRVMEETNSNFEEVLNRDKFNRVYPWTGSTIRLLQLRILNEQIMEDNILFQGFGYRASRVNLKKRHAEFNTYFKYHQYNYHNQYAQTMAETGLFSLLYLLFFLFYNLRFGFRSRNFFFIGFAVLIPIVFLTESFLMVHRGLLFFTFVFCLGHQANLIHDNKKSDFS